jgi:hypothetical protein
MGVAHILEGAEYCSQDKILESVAYVPLRNEVKIKFGSEIEEVEGGEDFIMRSFITCTFHKILLR